MSFRDKMKQILHELKAHSPFTLFGAATGIIFMLIGEKWFKSQAHALFSVFHPLHVVLSAMVTAALFKLHRNSSSFLLILVIGIVGSIGVATLSDCILPYFGETILGASIPAHSAMHEEAHGADNGAIDTSVQPEPHPKWHIGFIEEWYLVFPAALLGVILAYVKPATHLPHASHVLVSTWASSAHMLMNTQAEMSFLLLVGMFIVLFIAVWLPCCVSDIIFPLLFVGSDGAHLGHSCILCGHEEKKHEL